MKLYAYTTPDIPKHAGYLKIGETHSNVETRVKQQGHEHNLTNEIVWTDAVITDRANIDKLLHRFLKEQGFHVQQFDDTGKDTEWIKCTVNDIKKAFDIIKQRLYDEEKQRDEVGKQFYLEIRNWFYWTTQENKNIDADYALRLVIRLLFCFFLREKNELVPKELLDANIIQHLKNDEYSYSSGILRNLFFHCLNTQQGQRKYEHEKLLVDKNIKKWFTSIPFLNGGLFDEHDKDDVPIANDYFFSNRRTRTLDELGEKCEVYGIITILSKYQYKLTLDDLLEQAEYTTVDPEFIGKVFESLLSCIDSDSKESRRRVTGSYYTPREIVDYMVNEALDAYLQSKQQSEPQPVGCATSAQPTGCGSEGGSEDLLQCKILDPACGSGAFPCKAMNIIMHRIEEDIKERENRSLDQQERHRTKLKIVRDVIYGVDIQPMAVQITLLRFFLSLIQDIVPDKRKANDGIEPLPNLEIKFVCADTLIPLDASKKDSQGESQKMLENHIIRNTRKLLQQNRNQYFAPSMRERKLEIQQTDKTLRETLAIAMESNRMITQEETQKMAAWNPYDPALCASFFDADWMFGINEGFDIIIGNPPYIQLQKQGGALAKRYEKMNYQTFARTGDIYALFYERGWQLLKEGGHLCFITSNKWMRAGYGESLRKFFAEKTDPLLLLDFAGTKIFDSATVDVNILLFARGENRKQTVARVVQSVEVMKQSRNLLAAALVRRTETQSYDCGSAWVIISPMEQRIKAKIEAVGTPLKDWDIQIYRGVVTGYNEAFIIDGVKRAELIAADPKSAEIIKPILRGRDIKRYSYKFADVYLIATFPVLKIDIETYPAVKEHLLSFGYDRLKQTGERGARSKVNNEWFETQATIAYWQDFSMPKIVYPETTQGAYFCVDESGIYLDKTCFMLISPHIKYLCAILSSKLYEYAYKNIFSSIELGNNGYQYNKHALLKLPILRPAEQQEQQIERLLDGREYEAIDTLIYALYGLSDAEIALVAG